MEKSNESGPFINGYRSRTTRLLWIAALPLLVLAAITAAVLKQFTHPTEVAITAAEVAQKSIITTLASFNGTNGARPNSGLVLFGSTLYGTTLFGGVKYQPHSRSIGEGTVFSVPITGGTPTDIASFSGGANGRQPWGNLTLSGKTLYGTTNNGGTSDVGTVFSVPITGGTPTILTSFNSTYGYAPHGSLGLIGRILYGTTMFGGVNSEAHNLGTVYSIPITGGTPTIIASLSSANRQIPTGDMNLIGSTLYGTTRSGIDLGGTVFSVPITGGTPTVLATFNGKNGEHPAGSLVLRGNTLYGTTEEGGVIYMPTTGEYFAGGGTVFSVPKTGGAPTILSTFNRTDGIIPQGLILSGSTLYGTTAFGGLYNKGTVFSVPITGGTPIVLANFSGANGASPNGGLILSGSTLYGTTQVGGLYSNGTVFSIPIPSATPTAKTSPSASDPTLQK